MSNPDSDLFDAARPYGGLLGLERLDKTSAEILADIRSHGYGLMDGLRNHMPSQWASRPLRIGFVENSEVNAWATKTESTDIVLIYRGTVEKLFGAFGGLMCIPEFLPQVGEPRGDRRPEPPLPSGFPPFPLLGRVLPDKPIRTYYPSDVARGAFVLELGALALYFVVLHEIGHVVAGHLELDDAQGGVPLISEVGFTGVGGLSPIPIRIIECDADAFSSHATSFVGLHPEMGSLRAETFGWKGVSPTDAAWISYSTAISVLFRVLDEAEQRLGRPTANEYPHPAVRSNLAAGRAIGLAIQAGTLDGKDLGRLVQSSLVQVEQTWASMGLPGRHFNLKSDAAQQIAQLSTELTREYADWLPRLKQAARLPPRWHGRWPALE